MLPQRQPLLETDFFRCWYPSNNSCYEEEISAWKRRQPLEGTWLKCTLWFQTPSVRDGISTRLNARMAAESHKLTGQLNGGYTATMTHDLKN